MNDGSDDDESDSGNRKGFDDDGDDELFDNDGIQEASMRQANLDSSADADADADAGADTDVFDSLKEDTPVKKPPAKRKLGAKPEVVKVPTMKRPKKVVSDSDDSPVKVNK